MQEHAISFARMLNGGSSSKRAPDKTPLVVVSTFLLLSACTTANHGSFVPNTHRGNYSESGRKPLGPVAARSCQTRVLYVFPSGPGPSTKAALQQAMAQYDGTEYLADVSIDNETDWGVGYARDCVEVTGMAY